MLIPFGRWAPGLADTTSGRSGTLDNCIPKADDAFGPMPQLVTLSTSDALSEAPRGHISFPKADGSYVRYVGVSDKIYQVDFDGSLTEIASSLTLPSGDDWSFCVFGTKLLFTNTTDGVYAYDYESGGSASAVSAAPAARFIFTVGNVVVALDCDGENRLMRNSAINDHTQWRSGGASYQPFEGGAELVGGVPVAQGAAIIFQREAVHLMQFGVTSGLLFTLNRMTSESGAISARSIVSANGWAYYMSTNGPQRIAPGMIEPEPIGAIDGVDRWILDNVDAGDLEKIEGAYSPFHRMVRWRIKVSGDSDAVFSRMVGFHVDYKKWTTFTVDTAGIMVSALPGYVYDDAPDVPYDEAPDVPYDDRSLGGGEPLDAAFDSDFKFATFSGTPLAVTATSARYLFPGSIFINAVTPDTDAENATVAIGVSDTPQGSLSFTSDESLNGDGDAMFASRGRAVKGRLQIPAGESWSYFRGFRDINESGK